MLLGVAKDLRTLGSYVIKIKESLVMQSLRHAEFGDLGNPSPATVPGEITRERAEIAPRRRRFGCSSQRGR